MPVVLEDFPTRYEVTIVDQGSESLTSPIRRFPEDIPDGTTNGLAVDVAPEGGERWTGTFAFGGLYPFSAIATSPDPEKFIVISGGVGYIVDAFRQRVKELEYAPILLATPVVSHGLILLGDHTTLAAVDGEGVRWTTDRLSFDGLRIESIGATHVDGYATDPRLDSEVPFRVDLATGAHSGGASPD